MTTKCTCDECTDTHQNWPYGADCCMGYGIVSFDYDCPVSDHADLAVKQHGPRATREDQT